MAGGGGSSASKLGTLGAFAGGPVGAGIGAAAGAVVDQINLSKKRKLEKKRLEQEEELEKARRRLEQQRNLLAIAQFFSQQARGG